MNGSDLIFYWIGLTTSIVGGVAVAGFMAWFALEWWIRAASLFKVLAAFYVDRVIKKRGRTPA